MQIPQGFTTTSQTTHYGQTHGTHLPPGLYQPKDTVYVPPGHSLKHGISPIYKQEAVPTFEADVQWQHSPMHADRARGSSFTSSSSLSSSDVKPKKTIRVRTRKMYKGCCGGRTCCGALCGTCCNKPLKCGSKLCCAETACRCCAAHASDVGSYTGKKSSKCC
ncbi:MAG: hypothetical protein KVP17_003312 [Porospora cf. gigantea B]|uniref:uncharacterized protein n=1 Tax=Porospora cf. gigantea B TaxID=2853592 RepID=UPI003571800F|nr:MAG: hypothetical protein KVP17_003312 [Porospora cf. gigantea B]